MMALQSITDISVDFYDKRHILINAKQYDKNSRFLSVTCYNRGAIYPISSDKHAAYIRYRKSDGYGVLNLCEINDDGKVIVELTEQMLAASGICYADLIVVDGGSANVDSDTGEIIGIDGSSILSTMTFCIDVSEVSVDNSEIESSYDYSGLNESLDALNAEYTRVILNAQSWAVGGTGTRANEDINNAKYWSELAHSHVVGDLEDKIVTGIKGATDTTYQTGFVDLTAEYVGAVSVTDVATVDEVKNYLGI